MTAASPGLIKVVHEDLTYLVADWPKGEVRADEIRRSSTVLRRLLTYPDLIQVWLTVVRRKDYFVGSDYIKILNFKRLAEVDFATAFSANQGRGNEGIFRIRLQQDSEWSGAYLHCATGSWIEDVP